MGLLQYHDDQRESVRVYVTLKIIILYNDLPVMNTTTINISRDGMLLDTGPTIYQKHDLLEVEFQDHEGHTQQWFGLMAEVVHASKNVLGVKFQKPATMNALMSQMMLGKLCYLTQRSA